MSAASEEIRDFLTRLKSANPDSGNGTFLDKIDALLNERDDLLKAGTAALGFMECPKGHEDFEVWKSDCSTCQTAADLHAAIETAEGR